MLDLVTDGRALTVLVGNAEGTPQGDSGLRVGLAVEGVLDLVTDGDALTVPVGNAEGTPEDITRSCDGEDEGLSLPKTIPFPECLAWVSY